VVGIERRVTLVIGDKSTLVRPPRDVTRAGLTSNIAVVLSTHRSTSPDMVLDHQLWLSCVDAVTNVLAADNADVFHEIHSTFVSRIFGTRWPRKIGTLERYATLLNDDDEAPSWGMIVWCKAGAMVGAAVAENWYRVGGPERYHDTYTSRIFVSRRSVEELMERISLQVHEVGGYIDQVVHIDGRKSV